MGTMGKQKNIALVEPEEGQRDNFPLAAVSIQATYALQPVSSSLFVCSVQLFRKTFSDLTAYFNSPHYMHIEQFIILQFI